MPEGINKNEMFGRIVDLKVSPLEYYKLVGDFNLLLQHELSEKLAQNTEHIGNIITLVTPGSDGRLEKGSFMSPLEVIAIVNADLDLDIYKHTLGEVLDHLSTTKLAKIKEAKGSQSSMVTATVTNAGARYQPGRIADNRLIYGPSQGSVDAKLKLGRQILGLKNDEVDKIAQLKRTARNVTERGTNRIAGIDALHFDLKTGKVFYDPEAYKFSFKIGPLRFVQNSLLVEEVKHIRRENDPDFISTLDTNIVNRLRQLSDDKMINLTRDSIEEISEHYAFFLRLYHKSERLFETSQQKVMQLTPTEAVEAQERLKTLTILMNNFKIQK